ncbi:hypothetical protein ACM66B_004154 [Microbotryomycetes sp. NB124-2]
MSDSDEYDSFFPEVTEEDFALAENKAQTARADSPAVTVAAPAPAPVRPAPYQPPRRQKPTIVRPRQYPAPAPAPIQPLQGTQQNVVNTSAVPLNAATRPAHPPPPAKKPRFDSNGPALGRNKEWVNPNPFVGPSSQQARPAGKAANEPRPATGPAAPNGSTLITKAQEDDDDEMPEINLMPNGTYAASRPAPALQATSAAVLPPPRPPERDLSALKEWGEGGASKGTANNTSPGKPVAWATGYLSGRADDAEPEEQRKMREELQRAKQEKDQAQKAMEEMQKKLKAAELVQIAKTGENTIIRRKMEQIRKEHEQNMTREQKYKETLQYQLKERDRELRQLQERVNVSDAFRRQENETSLRRGAPSQRPRARRASTVAPPPPVSPSVARPKAPAFPGFKSAFDDKVAAPSQTGQARETVTPGPSPRRNQFVTPEKAEVTAAMMVDEDVTDVMQLVEQSAGTTRRSVVQNNLISAALMHWTFLPNASSTASQQTPSSGNIFARSAANSLPRKQANGQSIGNSVSTSDLQDTTITPLATLQYLASVKSASSSAHLRDLLIALGVHPDQTNAAAPDSVSDTLFVQRACVALDGLVRDLSTGTAGITPLCRLLSVVACVAFRCRLAAEHWLNTSNAQASAPEAADMPVDAVVPTSELVGVLTQILAKFCLPSNLTHTKTNDRLSTYGRSNKKERPRRSRASNARQALSSKTGRTSAAQAQADVVDIDEHTCLALTCAVLNVLEALMWHSDSFSAEIFTQLLSHETALSVLLSPGQPTVVLRRTFTLLSLLASYSTLFRPIVGIQISGPDIRESKVPIFERVAGLMAKRTTIATIVEDHALDCALSSFMMTLSTKHVDAIVLITSSLAFLPRLISKIHGDAGPCWDKDGLSLTEQSKAVLELTVTRLTGNVHLLYYLVFAPTSTLQLGEYFAQARFSHVQDDFYSAFGMLAFGGVPDWARDMSGVKEKLAGLAELALDVLEDVCPNEIDAIGECYQYETIEGGTSPAKGAEGGQMDVDGDEGDELVLNDDELAMMDLSQPGAR